MILQALAKYYENLRRPLNDFFFAAYIERLVRSIIDGQNIVGGNLTFHFISPYTGKTDWIPHIWIDEHISDYNTDFYYQPRDYIAACYEEGVIL